LLIVDKFSKEKFGIKHTARDGIYTAPGFTDKNLDMLPANLVEAINQGERVFKRIFNLKVTDDEIIKEEKVAKFLGYKFRQEMQSLMDELLSNECNFCRCIKPNEDKKPDYWKADLALL
jgi:myosin heavy subunit